MDKFFDRASEPTTEEISAYVAQGYTGAAGYIGGYTPYPWSRRGWERCKEQELRLLAIYVAQYDASTRELGVSDGNDALLHMQGLGLTGVLVLDLEAGYHFTNDYVEGFADALDAGSCALALYGRSVEIAEMAVDKRIFTWLANPQGPRDVLSDTAGIQLWYGPDIDTSLFDSDAYTTGITGPIG